MKTSNTVKLKGDFLFNPQLNLLQLINFENWIIIYLYFNLTAHIKRLCWKWLIFLQLIRLVIFSGLECEGHTVDTETLARWLWSIIKYVTKVGVTLCPIGTKEQTNKKIIIINTKINRKMYHEFGYQQRHLNMSKANLNFVCRVKLSGTHIFTQDLRPCTTETVVRATNNGGVAFVGLPCPVCLCKWRPARPGVVLWLWARSRHTSSFHSGRGCPAGEAVDFFHWYLKSGASQQTQWYIPTSEWWR